MEERRAKYHLEAQKVQLEERDEVLDKLISAISKLDIENRASLIHIQFTIVNFCISAHAMQKCIQNLHDLAMIDPVFGMRAAAALATVSNLKVDGFKMRNVLIKNLQCDYSKSESLYNENKTHFMNMVGFLGQVFSRVQLNDEPIKVLSVPHLVYQKRLLAGDETELELCVLLLVQNGELLEKCLATNSTLLTDFFITVMSQLLDDDITKKKRAWLMLAYHLKTTNYNLTHKYLTLFTNVLGPQSMTRIVCALDTGRTGLPIKILDEESLSVLRAGPPEEGDGDGVQK